MDFSGFAGIIFRGFHVRYLKVTKTEAIWSFSLHCVQSISLKFSNVKKEQIFAGFLLEGVCFHGIELSQINDKSAKNNQRKFKNHIIKKLILCMRKSSLSFYRKCKLIIIKKHVASLKVGTCRGATSYFADKSTS